jgi:YfiH family protein
MNPKFITSENLIFSNCKYGFFTRQGGVSTGIYHSLNCSYLSHDSNNNIDKNRKIISQELYSLANSLRPIVIPTQQHTNICKIIDSKFPDKFIADSIITKRDDIILSILTADCAPILLYENKEQIIGAVHAGWRGAQKGIIENTVEQILNVGGNIENLSAIIGPCIQQDSYEVGIEFYQEFIKQDPSNKKFFKTVNRGKYFNLQAYCLNKIYQIGIRKYDVIKMDTYKNEMDFFSYRRSQHRNEIDYGRQANAILIVN